MNALNTGNSKARSASYTERAFSLARAAKKDLIIT
jgi:hypothetical protein